MASRRLEADRFLTEDFNEKVYGKEGFRWIKSVKGIRDLLKRHYPKLEAEMPARQSGFKPYKEMPSDALSNAQ
jgi:hypothetical protein